jgi:mannose-1-phosphate guanylyltransferase
VDPTAQVRGGTAVGAGARVGAEAYVTGSVLFDAASIGAGARVSGSVIGRGTVVGEGVVLDGVVLGDEVHIAPGNELRCGLRVWPGQTLGLTCVRFSTDA